MKRLLGIFFMAAACHAQITLQVNAPEYGFGFLAGSTPYITFAQNNQPSCSALSSYSIDGSNNITVVGTCTGLTTTKTAWITGTGSFNTVGWALEGIPFVMTVASGTGFTAVYPGGHAPVSSTALAGTVQQNSGVNYSIGATTGGGSATFTDATHTAVTTLSGALPAVQVNIGSVQGNTCPGSGTSSANFAFTSSVTVTIHAQSADDLTVTNDVVLNVCQDTVQVLVTPAYQQAYSGQNHRQLQAFVPGTTNTKVTWAFVSQPSGGVATLADTTANDAYVDGLTVSGQYKLCATSVADGTQSGCGIIAVAPTTFASLGYTVTPNHTEPHPCWNDPAAFSTLYEIGPGFTYANLTATPSADTITPGSLFRLHNVDTTGTSPTTYNEYYQIFASGTATAPGMICGIPDSFGNLPVMDGANAGGQAGIATVGVAAGGAIISMFSGGFGHSSPNGNWALPPSGTSPNYWTVAGLHLIHASPSYNFIPPGGGSPTAYFSGASCLRANGGFFFAWVDNDIDTCANGLFTEDDSSHGWAQMTGAVYVHGNNVHNYGVSGSQGVHGFYAQSFWMLFEGNLFGVPLPGMLGDAFKWRGVGLVYRYNNSKTGTTGFTRGLDAIECQDCFGYQNIDGYFDQGWFTNGNLPGIARIAGYNESFRADFGYGNLFDATHAGSPVHYGMDVEGGMQDRNGVLHWFNNTIINTNGGFDNCGNNGGYNPVLQNRFEYRNDDMYGTSAASYQLNHCSEFIGIGRTNMFQTSAVSITRPITGGNHLTGQPTNGWVNSCDTSNGLGCIWQLADKLDLHQYLLTSPNFLSTSTQPVDTSTFIPIPGSPLISAGTAPAGVELQYPVRSQWDVTAGRVIPRVNALTIGARDEAGTSSGAVSSGSLVFFGATVLH